MKKLMDKIDRFCYTHPGFGLPKLMMYIVIGNVLVYFLSGMDTTGSLQSMLVFSPEMIFRHGQVWRLLTFVFVPEADGLWLVLWLYFYYFVGNALEDHWGTAKFSVFYLSGMLFTIVYGTLVWLVTGLSYGMTIHYVNLSMFFAFATLYPDLQVLFMFIIPVKVKWLAILDLVLFAAGIFSSRFPLNLLPVVALLNYVLFFGDWLFGYFGKEQRSRRKAAANYKNEVRRINHERASKPYRFKCEICGRTDVDSPELEFRFCSRCEGYHCYCLDHINDHVHKKS